MKYINVYSVMMFALSVIFVFPLCTYAASYSVTPLIIDKELEKRDIVREEITITNLENRVIRIFPSVNEVSVSDGGGIESFVEPSMVDDKATSITSWVEITRARIELAPGESKTVPITIRVNPEVKSGEYHAFIGFGDGSNRPEAEKKVRAGTAPGTVLRISVDKVQNEFLRLEKFAVERFITEEKEGSIKYVLQNPGSDPVTPAGEIIFYDNNGSEVYSMPVNPDALVIEGDKEVEIIDTAPSNLGIGKYKAFLSVEYGEFLTASVHDTAFFYVLPLKQLIIIFFIILVLTIIIALYVHRKYDMGVEDDGDGSADVPMYIRSERSESKDHDIDLAKKNND